MTAKLLTIGELARRVGMQTSALRFYEQQGLLSPAKRTEAGYRLYAPEAEQHIRFIQRAQQLGFSLNDILALLQARPGDSSLLVKLAEQRFLALERQITNLLILRRELELFLQDFNHLHLSRSEGVSSIFEHMENRLGLTAINQPATDAALDWLLQHTGCNLNVLEERNILNTLRGRHIHIWQDKDEYQIMIFDLDPAVGSALREMARLEAACQVHHPPQLTASDAGYLFTIRGENAFIFARLFLTLQAPP